MKAYSNIAAAVFALLLLASSASAYTTHINAPAVVFGQDTGILTTVSLNVTHGNGNVTIKGPRIVNISTLESAQAAAAYASYFVGVNEKDYNFTYTIYNASNVSGPSGGLAMTMLAVAALQGRQLPENFTATGTINQDGTVGEIGGVYDKAAAAASKGMHYILVPYVYPGSFENELYYISQQLFGIKVIEVMNVSQALGYVYGKLYLSPVSYNVTEYYHLASLQQANLTCTACNMSAFAELEGFTLNLTNATIESAPEQLSGLKQSMLGQEAKFAQIAAKGYLYAASDLSFLLYDNAYTIAASANITTASANIMISNLTSYCSSLTPPQMTNLNYEYVIGGELRQSWGSIYAGIAGQQLASSQSSDGLIEAINTAGKASGWCQAASKMYSIASSLGGQPVALNSSIKADAQKAISQSSSFNSDNLYYQSAVNNYKEENYGAALYAMSYAMAIYGSAYSMHNETLLMGNLSNFTYGAWPTQFALQARFYQNEAMLTGNQSENESAFYVAMLAKLLSSDNRLITASFYNVSVNSTAQQNYNAIESQVQAVQQQIQNVYVLLLAILVILLIILLMLFVVLLRPYTRKQAEASGNSGRRTRRNHA
ncbi:MAG: S16 family serine protease [Candidatus Micrarchaeaceae archaeon]